MGNKDLKNILAIDMGSYKISVIIAEILNSGTKNNLRIVGQGFAYSEGAIVRGEISHIDSASVKIQAAITSAERIAGFSPSEAIVSVSGIATRSVDSNGVINLKSGEVGIDELNRVMQTAKYNAEIPSEYEILHILPYRFEIDGNTIPVKDPLGMTATRLKVFANVILVKTSYINNLKKAIENIGLKIKTLVLNSYAAAIATRLEDEKDFGTAVIDIGADTSNFVIYTEGNSFRYHGFLGVGSANIDKDLSYLIHTSLKSAENLKKQFANFLIHDDIENEMIIVPAVGDENSSSIKCSTSEIIAIISARLRETFDKLNEMINDSPYGDQVNNIVLTGGIINIVGINQIARESFGNRSIRMAYPKKTNGEFAEMNFGNYSVVIGLALYANGEHTLYEANYEGKILFNQEAIYRQERRDVSLDNINIGVNNVPVVNNTPHTYQQPPLAQEQVRAKSIPVPPTTNEIPTIKPASSNQMMEQPIFSGNHDYTNNNSNQTPRIKETSRVWEWITKLF